MSNERFFIRRGTEKDAILIATIGARMFEETFGPDNRAEDMAHYIASNFSPANIEAELLDPASTFLLAYKGGTAIGYAKLYDSPTPNCVKGPRPIELARLYVGQNIIGKGYGSALMKTCLEEVDRTGYETIWLGVWEQNKRAIEFYHKWGFTTVGSQVFVLGGDVQNDLIMERSI